MLSYVEFVGEKFNHIDDNNLMDELTYNTIVICDSPDTKNELFAEFSRICFGDCIGEDDHVYSMGNEDDGRDYPEITSVITHYLPTIRFEIDGEQLITLTIEAPFVLTAERAQDLWFANTNNDGKISIWPMCIFQDYKEDWTKGRDYVYTLVARGNYGGYEGYWMPLVTKEG